MSDQATSLPVRTESAGDIDVLVSDATTPSQKLKVNADGSIDTNFATGSKIIVTDGTDDLEVNADGSINATISDGGGSITVDGTVAATQSGTWDVGTVGTITNDVNIADGGNSITVDAVDLDIRDLSATSDSVEAHLKDGSGNDFSPTNPLSVSMVSDAQGDEVCDYNTTASVAKDASTNHDYTVTAAKTFLAESAWVSGSGKLKVEVLSNGATIFVGFNSTANPNIDIPIRKLCKTSATQVIRMTITNLDNQAQDVYSTLTGLEV